MRIAIIGSGVSGLVCAHHLRERHDVTVLEADDRIGGHANTVRVDLADETHHVDTGFIVYNERNYPVFSRLLHELGVATEPRDMSLAITDERSGLEWGTAANRIFSQKRNLAPAGLPGDDRRDRPLEPSRSSLAGIDRCRPALAARRRSWPGTTSPRRFLDWYLVPHECRVVVGRPDDSRSVPGGDRLPVPEQPRDAVVR